MKKIKLAINNLLHSVGYSIIKTIDTKQFLGLDNDDQSEYEEIIKLPGCLGSDAFKLFKNLSELNYKTIDKALEIGVFCGRSLLGIALAFPNAKVVGVDPFFEDFSDSPAFENEAAYLRNKSGNTTKKQRIEKIWLIADRLPKTKGRIRLEECTQDAFITKNTEKFDLVHIDGEHSYKAVFDIIDQFNNVLSPDSLVIVDDMPSPAFPEISEAVYAHPNYNKNLFPIFYGFNKAVFIYSPSNKEVLFDIKNKLYNSYNSNIYTTRKMHDGSIMTIKKIT